MSVVHDVVALRDLVEHVVDQALLGGRAPRRRSRNGSSGRIPTPGSGRRAGAFVGSDHRGLVGHGGTGSGAPELPPICRAEGHPSRHALRSIVHRRGSRPKPREVPLASCQNFPKSKPSAAAWPRSMTGATLHLASSSAAPGLRFPFPERFAERLAGRRVEAVGRRAKYLVDRARRRAACWSAHLGMTGSFRVVAGGGAQGRAAETTPGSLLSTGAARRPSMPGGTRARTITSASVFDHRHGHHLQRPPALRLHGAGRAAGRASTPHPAVPSTSGWSRSATAFDARDAGAADGRPRSRRSRPRCSTRGSMAGLGNIYVCEALHRARLSPTARRRHAGAGRDGASRPRGRSPPRRRHPGRCSTRRWRPAARP